MPDKISDMKTIRKKKAEQLKEDCKRILLKKINNGYLAIFTNRIGLFMLEDEEDNPKKDMEEFYFKTIEEALEFVHTYFTKGFIEK